MFNFLKDLDTMSIILISVSVILIIYIIQRSSKYSGSLIEGLTNKTNKSNDHKMKFATAIKKWESATIKYKSADMTDINKLANSIMNELDLSNNRSDYEEILADLESIGNSFSLILCVQMMKDLNKMVSKDTIEQEQDASMEVVTGVMNYSNAINSLQEFKRNLSDIHSWTTTAVPATMNINKTSSIFGSKKKSDKDDSEGSSLSSNSGFSL